MKINDLVGFPTALSAQKLAGSVKRAEDARDRTTRTRRRVVCVAGYRLGDEIRVGSGGEGGLIFKSLARSDPAGRQSLYSYIAYQDCHEISENSEEKISSLNFTRSLRRSISLKKN